jgi:hypothetical protein
VDLLHGGYFYPIQLKKQGTKRKAQKSLDLVSDWMEKKKWSGRKAQGIEAPPSRKGREWIAPVLIRNR